MENLSKNILIVEDDMIISMVLKRMVSNLNHTIVDTLRTGEQAVKVATQKLPDLILMDIQLSDEVDGIEAMRQIKKTADIPVIYITGNSDSFNRNRAREVGYLDYLTKPIRLDDLDESIRKSAKNQTVATQ